MRTQVIDCVFKTVRSDLIICAFSVGEPVCEHGSTRLVDGNGNREGVVQVCFHGLWGSIFSHSWDFSEARVACKSLGRNEYGEYYIHVH